MTLGLLADIREAAPRYGAVVSDLVAAGKFAGATIRAAWEQEPRPQNAVTLSSTAKDRFGVPRVVLKWKKGPLERRTVRVSVEVFNKWLMKSELGRIRLNHWVVSQAPYPEDDELAGYHHMGGTRMGIDRQSSVVDADCRIHGTQNLYVAGSSVFSTSGANNPTFPLVQLALRLGDHLAKA